MMTTVLVLQSLTTVVALQHLREWRSVWITCSSRSLRLLKIYLIPIRKNFREALLQCHTKLNRPYSVFHEILQTHESQIPLQLLTSKPNISVNLKEKKGKKSRELRRIRTTCRPQSELLGQDSCHLVIKTSRSFQASISNQ